MSSGRDRGSGRAADLVSFLAAAGFALGIAGGFVDSAFFEDAFEVAFFGVDFLASAFFGAALPCPALPGDELILALGADLSSPPDFGAAWTTAIEITPAAARAARK